MVSDTTKTQKYPLNPQREDVIVSLNKKETANGYHSTCGLSIEVCHNKLIRNYSDKLRGPIQQLDLFLCEFSVVDHRRDNQRQP